MNINKYTEKAQEAILGAQQLESLGRAAGILATRVGARDQRPALGVRHDESEARQPARHVRSAEAERDGGRGGVLDLVECARQRAVERCQQAGRAMGRSGDHHG